jgi:hypothetical protein
MVAMTRFGATALLAAIVAAISGEWREAKADVAYVSDQGHGFGTLNLSTGAFTLISTAGPQYYRGLQFVNSQLYGEGSDSHLYQINTATGAATDLGALQIPNNGVAIRDNVASSQQGLSYVQGFGVDSILPPSTAATLTVIPQLSGNGAAVASNGLIYEQDFFNGGGGFPAGLQLDTVNPMTGVESYVASLSMGFNTFFFDGSTLYGFQFGFYTINTTTGAANKIASFGDIFTAGAVEPSAVPEPASFVMFGMGMLGMLGYARIKRRASKKPDKYPAEFGAA